MDPPRRRLPPRLDRRGRPPAAAGGKALRPALALLSARAAETSYETALPGAVAVEFVHAFSLLHDDIMDGDRTRRHRPAAWTVFGPSAAILGGDALLALSEELLLDQHTRGAHWAARALTAATQRLISGQALDIGFESRDDVALDECLTMAADKTGALLACACSIGAMLGEGPTRLVTALTGYGAELGLAFQLVDDLLGIWGSPETTGKPVLSDLRARKKSLPVVYALTSGGRSRGGSPTCTPTRSRRPRTPCGRWPGSSRRRAAGTGPRPRRTAASPPRTGASTTPAWTASSPPSSATSHASSPPGTTDTPARGREGKR
ncbi:polyprenyl synthetase family protein [Actinomadura madurae]|uniref:polyprenyl synthetase family protein n=1 Tax=Actinomadura madurae TaxID=1993 RepID=UPI0020D22213|nr:polyprenyl synthetase family protein [Actinomadura madurae]MCP9970269.1 polyprenyl synthetase family protein [Actinomadura madurae]